MLEAEFVGQRSCRLYWAWGKDSYLGACRLYRRMQHQKVFPLVVSCQKILLTQTPNYVAVVIIRIPTRRTPNLQKPRYSVLLIRADLVTTPDRCIQIKVPPLPPLSRHLLRRVLVKSRAY